MESTTIADIKAKMEYVRLGKTGLKVSKFAYGNWITGHGSEEEHQTRANELVKMAYEAGVNLFDTAEGYGKGQGEIQMGNALRALSIPRSDYVLTTKIFFGQFPQNGTAFNSNCTNRKHIVEGLNRSLLNLGFEYVDIVFCHRYDGDTPTLEVCQTMKDIISSGKAFYWATSEWPAVRIMEAILICDQIGAPRPIADQCIYNMVKRHRIEKDYPILFDDYEYGTTTWSPLHYGILTGKYNNGIPEGTRLADMSDVTSLKQPSKSFLVSPINKKQSIC